MSKPNHTTGLASLYARLQGLVTGSNASAVWRTAPPPGSLPAEGDLPLVVFSASSNYDQSTDTLTNSTATLQILVVRHRRDNATASDACVGAIVDLLDRWAPTVSGVGTNPWVLRTSGDGQYDDEHAADLLEFETLYAEE